MGHKGVAMVRHRATRPRLTTHSFRDEAEDGDGIVREVVTLELLAVCITMLVLHNVVSETHVVIFWHLPGDLLHRPCLPACEKFVDGKLFDYEH